jgi:hypothetical protein
MVTPELMARLADEVRNKMQYVTAELATFPSGAAMLHVHYGNRLFVLAYSRAFGFGVDEVNEGEGLGTWFRFGFDDFQSAKDKLLSMLEAAKRGESDS